MQSPPHTSVPDLQRLFPHAQSIIQLLESLVLFAHTHHSSDIHIDPRREYTMVRFRVDGVLGDICTIATTQHPELISRIKICARLRTDEHQAPQDGRFLVQENEIAIDIRVSIVPTYYGENAVLRLLVPQQNTHTLGALGFDTQDTHLLQQIIKKTSGMILITGPTGSGKTTTLYTLLNLLNTPGVSIVTLEDPIEYSLQNIKQIHVNQNAALTFSSGLRAVVRQDPNIIMVGEIRDHETAALAIHAALTGHLLLSTLHTNDAATALPRLIDMHIEPYLVASTVSSIISQRLIRKICSECKVPYTPTEAECAYLQKHASDDDVVQKNYFHGAGCATCLETGYSGRLCISEILQVTPAIQELIISKASAEDIRLCAKKEGLRTLLENGLEKVRARSTDITELLRVLHE